MRRSSFGFLPLLGLLAVGVLGLNGALTPPGAGTSQVVAATSYKAMTVTLKGGTPQVVRWNGCQRVITYKVNLSKVPAARRASLLRTVRTSFVKLAAVDGVAYQYMGATTFVPKKSNLKNAPAEIVVAAVVPAATDLFFEGHTLGVGGALWNSWEDAAGRTRVAAVRGYVLLNVKSLPSLKGGFGRGRTAGNLVLHELGHVMGLDHVRSSTNLMNPVLSDSSPNGYGPGDKRGLRAMGAEAACISVPSSALPDLS